MATVIDFDALQESGASLTVDLYNQSVTQNNPDAFSGFAGLDKVLLLAQAVDKNAGRPASVAIVVEHSDDGVSWTTAHEFDFSSSGSGSVEVSSPKDFWRARKLSASGSWRVTVTATPTSVNVPATGGSQPEKISLPIAFNTAGLVVVNPGKGDWDPQGIKLCDLNPGDLLGFTSTYGGVSVAVDTAWDGSGAPALQVVTTEQRGGGGDPPVPLGTGAGIAAADIALDDAGDIVLVDASVTSSNGFLWRCVVATSLYVFYDDGDLNDPVSSQGSGLALAFIYRAS